MSDNVKIFKPKHSFLEVNLKKYASVRLLDQH